MPVVQRYGNRQVATRPLPGVRRTAGETELSTGAELQREKSRTAQTLANVGDQALSVAGGELVRMAREAKQEADEIAFLEASNRFTERMNAWQFNPETGAYGRQGKDALSLPNEFAEVFTKASSEIGATLKTAEQRELFSRWLLQQRTSIDGEVKRHVFNQMKAYDAAETKSALENVRNSAIANANEPRIVGEKLAFGEALLSRWADRNGVGEETLNAARAELRSTVHEGVVMSLLAQGNVAGARGYYQELKAHEGDQKGSQLSGEAVKRIEAAMREGTVREESQAALEKILGEGGTLEEQRKRARERYSGEVEDRVLQLIEHEYQLGEQRRRDRIEAIMVNAKNTIDRTGRWQAIAPGDWVQLSPAEASALRGYSEQVTRGVPVKTVFAEKYQLIKLSADDPEAFRNVNLNSYVDRISEQDLEQLALMQASIRKGDTKAAEKQFSGFRSQQQVVDDQLVLYNFNPNAKDDTPEGRAIALARDVIDRRVQALAQSVGRELTNEETRQIAHEVLSQDVEVKGALWGSSKKPLVSLTIDDVGSRRPILEQALRAAGRQADDKALVAFDVEVRSRLGNDLSSAAITRIPRKDVQDIALALQTQGKTATPDAIMQLYLRLLAQGTFR